MSAISQNVAYASLAIAALMTIACILDFISAFPFGGQTTFDVLFLLGSLMTGYLAFDCLKK